MSTQITVPAWLTQIATAAVIPLWLWVLALSQERAAIELRLSALEKTQTAHNSELKELVKMTAALEYVEKEIGRLAKELDL